MPKKPADDTARDISLYNHKGKQRLNNPPVGLVDVDTDKDSPKKTYAYDPHIDPSLQWAGKAEHTTFKVPTVSLHVHERIDPFTIVNAVRKQKIPAARQVSLFDSPEEHLTFREAVEFYKHKQGWSNRLIAGDSLLVMNSLLEKEGMAGQVQMIYIDPPYGIKYGSNFQPFVNKRDVKDNKDEDLTQEPEMIKAFRDTWELGISSYLTYIRDRILLARELLALSGSIFVQISDENVHLVRSILDEVFTKDGFVANIAFKTKLPLGSTFIGGCFDHILWYTKSKDELKKKYHSLWYERDLFSNSEMSFVELPNGDRRKISGTEKDNPQLLPAGSKIFQRMVLSSAGKTESCVFPFDFNGETFYPIANRSWKTNKNGMENLKQKNRLIKLGDSLYYVLYYDDFPVIELSNMWPDTTGGYTETKKYVVQTSNKVIQRCMLMCTDPGDLVLDPTCGSGTTAHVAEQWGRRWITCDTSRVAIALTKQRLMTSTYDYYKLAQPQEGVDSGFVYKTVPHITLGSIANNEPPAQETLYDQPEIDKNKVRVSGKFTVEAVPAPVVAPLDEIEEQPAEDASISHSGETWRQSEWRDELLRTGIRLRLGQKLEFSRVEPLQGTRWLQADAETKEDTPRRAVICFGNEFMPLDARMVELALEEAGHLMPKPKLVVFASFQFDPEAAKDIDEMQWGGVTLLKVQMNTDLLTEDLKKKRSSNESFWLIGQPDVQVTRIEKGPDKKKYVVKLNGFDYYNTKTGKVESGGSDRVAMWMLDTDYDGRSLFPRQVFFPMAGDSEGWSKLAKNLKAEIDQDLVEAYRGTESLPFEVDKLDARIAVKIVDDRGIESFRVINIAEVR